MCCSSMKYYEVICHTPYCGEDACHYLALPDNTEIYDVGWSAEVAGLEAENAYEWYDEVAEDDYGSFEEYLSCCHSNVREITKAEYDEYS